MNPSIIEPQTPVGSIVADDYRTAEVFRSLGIDFCCQGQRTLAEACSLKQLEPAAVAAQLETVIQTQNQGHPDFRRWPADLLIDYIEKKHHRYVSQQIPRLQAYLEKICQVHGAKHPELWEIASLFQAAAQALSMHMKKEELILFPYVRQMVSAQEKGDSLPAPSFGAVEHPLAMMEAEHDQEGARFRQMAELSQGYTPPEDACNTYRVAFALLAEFEADLHAHIHLENNLLFPQARQMEQQLRAG